jgi:diaminohydroxyphosphoribosylaminopyrimidine deaminase/5-amino-6-(5-phosphoribosylamino)uracil reductase
MVWKHLGCLHAVQLLQANYLQVLFATPLQQGAAACLVLMFGSLYLQVVGEGFHPKAGMPHAEVYALRAAGGPCHVAAVCFPDAECMETCSRRIHTHGAPDRRV